MTPRERVLTALDHREADRVPIDLGGSCVTTIATSTYAALRDHMGLPAKPVRMMEMVQQVAFVDEDAMDALGCDVVPVFANPPSGPETIIIEEPGGSRSFHDDFGAVLRKPAGGFYYDWQEFPIGRPSIEDLRQMPWPDPADPARYRGLRDRVAALRARTDRALFSMAPCGHDLLNQLFRFRGMEEGLIDLVASRDFAEAFLDRLTETICTAQACFLREVGDLVDVHFAAADLAGQHAPLLSPATYRTLVKPRQARIVSTIQAHTRARIFYHSCGAVGPFLDDLIEMGVQILNPVQVSASGMDTAGLKRRYGTRLSFWGGGCDTQRVLGQCTPEEVRAEVARRVADLAPGGGFVFNPVHNIQPGVPPANIVAMFEAARESGRYGS